MLSEGSSELWKQKCTYYIRPCMQNFRDRKKLIKSERNQTGDFME